MALTRHVLTLFSLFALYAIFYFSEINGLNRLSLSAVDAGVLPGTDNVPLRTVYTGIKPLDQLLTVLGTFFWPVVDGQNITLTLHSISFSGAFGAAWMLVVLEAWRDGNSRTIAAFPAVFGLTAQIMTYAFATPLYCGFQLANSITAQKPTAANIRISRPVLHCIPLAFIIGYMIPSALMLVAPVSTDTKQILIASWQPWPAYVSILVTIVDILFSPRRKVEPGRATLRALRRVYAFAFATTALPHIVSWTVSLASVRVPFLFNEKYLDALHPREVFKIAFPWSKPTLQVDSVAAGVHVFLRWDFLIGSLGVLLWAMTLNAVAHREILGKVGWLSLFVKTGLLVVLTGPVGTAVELMWERDELVIQEAMALKRLAQGNKRTR
ncbi:hypothetical protein VTO42DRAFT_3520 [Malbranchea cinnamomea]